MGTWIKSTQTAQVRIPCGLVARIRRFHRRGRGSIPRKGETTFWEHFLEISVHSSVIGCHGDLHPTSKPGEQSDVKIGMFSLLKISVNKILFVSEVYVIKVRLA